MHFMMVGFCGSFFPCLLHIGVFYSGFQSQIFAVGISAKVVGQIRM